MAEYCISDDAVRYFGDIARLEEICFPDPWSESNIRMSAENPAFVCLAATSVDSLAGYGMMYATPGESEIINIAVAPEHRRNGAGELIMKRLLSEAAARNAEIVYLEVRETNTAARRLYEKLGFKVIGKRKNYYRKPTEDALLMARSLTGLDPET